MTKTANFSAGRYTLSFTADQRDQYTNGAKVLQVVIDGLAVSGAGIGKTSRRGAGSCDPAGWAGKNFENPSMPGGRSPVSFCDGGRRMR